MRYYDLYKQKQLFVDAFIHTAGIDTSYRSPNLTADRSIAECRSPPPSPSLPIPIPIPIPLSIRLSLPLLISPSSAHIYSRSRLDVAAIQQLIMKRESLRSNTLHKEQARNIIVTAIIMLAIAICLMYPLLSTILLSSLILSYLLFYSLILSSLLFSSLQLPLVYWYLINKYIQVRITVDHILRSSVHIFFQAYTGMNPLFLDLHLAHLLISSRLLSSPKFFLLLLSGTTPE